MSLFSSHRQTSNQQSLEKWPDMQAMAKQFPWARQQVDGTFQFDVLRAYLDIIGTGAEFGWWTEQPCCKDKSSYVWGFLLLRDRHLQERAGWKLPDNQIPWLDFALSGSSPPGEPPSFDHTWAGYYQWRGLPIHSPAVLLLHWPLTVYKLLHSLGLVPTHPPTERRRLTIHLLGIEKELDFLPVFVFRHVSACQHRLTYRVYFSDLENSRSCYPTLISISSCLDRVSLIYSHEHGESLPVLPRSPLRIHTPPRRVLAAAAFA
jgi:hypothetical protein